MFRIPSSSLTAKSLLAGVTVIALSAMAGCGIGPVATQSAATSTTASAGGMSGIIHGGPNPIIGATITLYTTSSTGYGATARVVATTTTDTSGYFNIPLPTNGVACPTGTGTYAYIGAYSGNTGSNSNNVNNLMMVPIGSCDNNYSSTNTSGVYTNTYLGQSLWIDELSTAVSAYALGNFTTTTSAGAINIGAPANNTNTPSATTPSAAGLGHAFANALALVNNHTGQPNAYTNSGTSAATGGVIPDAEIFLLGNILQACVNTSGVTGSNTATSNDGSGCGKLFSLVTPPQAGAAVPANTLQAMIDLAKYPNPLVNTWNTACTAAGGSTTTATSCLFGLAAPVGAYTGALTSAPPDWALAVVYGSSTTAYGAQTTGCTSTCPGTVYPYYVALDYADNVYVLNYSASNTTYTNIIGIANSGAPIFSSPEDTTDLTIFTIGTDTAGHVFGVNESASAAALKVYSSTSGAVLATVSGLGASEEFSIADPLNNIYMASAQASINIRKATYTTGPSYAISSITTTAPAAAVQQIGFGTNLDLYLFTGTPSVALLPNTATYTKGTAAAPTYAANGLISATVTGTSGSAYGVAGLSNGGAIAIDSVGATPITKVSNTSITAGTPVALPTVYNSTLYNRGVFVDGNNFAFSPDGANGAVVSGVSVFDSGDSLALGTYKGCYVLNKVCGTTAGSAPMYSPRAAAIDSSGDVWVVSGASSNLTELIGVAAPTWPGLSLGQRGTPQ